MNVIKTSIPGYYTRKEAAKALGLSVIRLVQMARDGGELPVTVRIGGRTLYSAESLGHFERKRAGIERQADAPPQVLPYEENREQLGEYYTRRGAAKYLGLSEQYVATLGEPGRELQATVDLGRLKLYSRHDLEVYKTARKNADKRWRDGRRVYTVKQTARFLGLTPAAVYARIKRGALQAIYVSRRPGIKKEYLVPIEALFGGKEQ